MIERSSPAAKPHLLAILCVSSLLAGSLMGVFLTEFDEGVGRWIGIVPEKEAGNSSCNLPGDPGDEERQTDLGLRQVAENRYGFITLTFQPRDASVAIRRIRYVRDCSHAVTRGDLLNCFRGKFDYERESETTEIFDSSSLRLNRSKREVIDRVPLDYLPIQEVSEEGTMLYRYEFHVRLEADGYLARTFLLSGDRERLGANSAGSTEVLLWEQKAPGIYTVDFPEASLLPTPETVREHFRKAHLVLTCLDHEVAWKRKAGKTISELAVRAAQQEFRSAWGFLSSEEWNRVETGLRRDVAWWKDHEDELKKYRCEDGLFLPLARP